MKLVLDSGNLNSHEKDAKIQVKEAQQKISQLAPTCQFLLLFSTELIVTAKSFPDERFGFLSTPEISRLIIPILKIVPSVDFALYKRFFLFFQFLNMKTVLIDASELSLAQTAQWIQKAASNQREWNIEFYLRIKLSDRSNWIKLREIDGICLSIKLALELDSKEPPSPEILHLWNAEPIGLFHVPEKSWLENANGYPVLSTEVQVFIQNLSIHETCLLVIPNNNRSKMYLEYLENCIKHRKLPPQTDMICADILQYPLQPLHDNLPLQTYQVFVQDGVKYKLYEESTMAALSDIMNSGPSNDCISIMILGAGSDGPLLRTTINAIGKLPLKTHIRIVVIEKNPFAVFRLNQVVRKDTWWLDFESIYESIAVHETDIRDFSSPIQFDIIISELLGSIGDNELSPECLDAAQKHLKRSLDGKFRGTLIPKASRAYFSPVSSSKLRSEILKLENEIGIEVWNQGYVVKFRNVADKIFEPKLFWEFEHPSEHEPSSTNEHNQRFVYIEWTNRSQEALLLDGMAGYFESTLYESHDCRIILSTNPSTHTPGLVSWFPMFFPFIKSIRVLPGDKLRVYISRNNCHYRKLVWYEWQVEIWSFDTNHQVIYPLMNPEGHGYNIKY